MFNKNHIVLGIIIGICLPVVGYALIMMLFETLESAGIMDEVTSGSAGRRVRTLSLLGICTNIIPFEIYRKKRFDNTMRGLVFPTVIYIGIWIFMYKDILFGG
ncbi:hypothetical protein [Portibacter lacus]|uniref:Uncharacterized protein n=1 Tax=Portibacter lacus TaxID=1099794 RepID=A0AA37WG76_9BACT|nr:hypothetical protein [Portibacter lacus]GLR19422.1 hypothetical protein GCM10007940_40380 [Portibacter lacus]